MSTEQWEQKLEVVKAQIEGKISVVKQVQETQGKLLEKMDEKLDTIIRNGNKGRERI